MSEPKPEDKHPGSVTSVDAFVKDIRQALELYKAKLADPGEPVHAYEGKLSWSDHMENFLEVLSQDPDARQVQKDQPS